MEDKDITQLLERCKEAMDTWVCTYASEMCDDESVRVARQRISDGGGTLNYIATLTSDLRDALKHYRSTAAPQPSSEEKP